LLHLQPAHPIDVKATFQFSNLQQTQVAS
jgi:hypothetical protein